MHAYSKQLSVAFLIVSSLSAMENNQNILDLIAQDQQNIAENYHQQLMHRPKKDLANIICALQSQRIIPQAQTPLHLNINTMAQNNVEHTVHVQQVTEVISALKNEVKNEIKHYTQESKNYINDLFDRHKSTLAFSAGVGLYLYVGHALLQGKRFLNRKDSWSTWREEMTLKNLMSLNHKHVCDALLISAQQRYMNSNNPTDIIHPIAQCSRDIDQEIIYLTHYLRLTAWLKRCFIFWLFPVSNYDIQCAKKRRKKLYFLQGLLKSWAIELKLNTMSSYEKIPSKK